MSLRHQILSNLHKYQLFNKTNNKKVSSYFGQYTFNEKIMREKLSNNTYLKLKKCINGNEKLSLETAHEIAHAMKEWAISLGVTHYCHWFQPLTGTTAEKHDSFLDYTKNGDIIEHFSGEKLVRQEPDASSFPSGGLRATFEARGYTAWDPTSPAFVIKSQNCATLCIPSIFISYTGESLDKKTPLLKSCELLSKSVKKLLNLFGLNLKKIKAPVGVEQEFFLIDRQLASLRPDLIITGRTLFGNKPPKGQELEDQYFGSIKERVLNYINDVEEELYKLGIPVVTRHNEVAPAQFELAQLFEDANLACDHNQLMMEILRKKAVKHGLFVAFHEKPFSRINGNGKHLNWSISADDVNLLEPGKNPQKNIIFLTVLISIIKAVKDYAPLLRASVASAGNDYRLGSNEAPPAIISIYLGKQLTYILEMIEKGNITDNLVDNNIKLGIKAIPNIPKDTTDRNRTSPLAFTGNKFEFRAVGSHQSIALPTTILNTIVADSILKITQKINEKNKEIKDIVSSSIAVIKELIPDIKPILFEGDNYSIAWKKEAEKRGLPDLKSTPEAITQFNNKNMKNVLEKHNVFSEKELEARVKIELERYEKTIEIEAKMALEIVRTKIEPSLFKYQKDIAININNIKQVGLSEEQIKLQIEKLDYLISLGNELFKSHSNLEREVLKADSIIEPYERANFFKQNVLNAMENLRKIVDEIEGILPDNEWSLPKYYELLFYI